MPGRRPALARFVVFASLGSLLQAAHAQEAVRRRPEWATRVGKSPNLFQVTPTLFRSAQLSQEDVDRVDGQV